MEEDQPHRLAVGSPGIRLQRRFGALRQKHVCVMQQHTRTRKLSDLHTRKHTATKSWDLWEVTSPCAGVCTGYGEEISTSQAEPSRNISCYLVNLLFLFDILRLSPVLLFCVDGKKSVRRFDFWGKVIDKVDYYWTRKNTVQSCNQIVNVAVTIKAKMLLTQRGHLHKYVSKVRAKTRIDECA